MNHFTDPNSEFFVNYETGSPEEAEDQSLAAIAVAPEPMLVENCLGCGRLFVPPRVVEVLARSDVQHARAYGCDACVVQAEADVALRDAQYQLQREETCRRDNHFPTNPISPYDKNTCLTCGKILNSVWDADRGCWLSTEPVLAWFTNRGLCAGDVLGDI